MAKKVVVILLMLRYVISNIGAISMIFYLFLFHSFKFHETIDALTSDLYVQNRN